MSCRRVSGTLGPPGRRVRLLVVCLALLVTVGAAEAAGENFSARLSWAPVPGAVGYRVYFRNGATAWDAGRDVGAGRRVGEGRVEVDVERLPLGNRNLFSVAAYDLRGREGVRSGERGLSRAEILSVVPSPTPAPTSSGEPDPGVTPSPTPTIVPTATPVGPQCGDGEVDEGETCDGDLDTSCPGFCSDDCTCLPERDLPLRGWTRVAGDGSWSVNRILDDDGVTPIRVLQTDTGDVPAKNFGIAWPPLPSLGAAARTLSVVLQATENFAVRAVVRDVEGTLRRLVYTTGSLVPTRRGRTVDFPIERSARSPDFVEVKRDLAADLAVATGRELATVEQVALFGRMSVKGLQLSRSPDASLPPRPGASLELPSQGWAWNGEGSVDQGLRDDSFEGPILLAAPGTSGFPQLSLPAEARRRLVAPYGRLTAEVAGEDGFEIELVLTLSDRSDFRLTYDGDAAEEKLVSSRVAILPLPAPETGATEGGSRVLVADPEGDLARLRPGAKLAGIARVRLRGGFRAGPILFDRRLSP